MKKYLSLWTAPLLWQAGLAAVPASAQAQVVAMPNTTDTAVTQRGDQFDIVGGAQAGGNLFHEFEALSIDPAQTANFISGSDVFNIVGRVSGGHPSYINGQVRVSGSNANLYLINPSGVLFGPNAQLSLQGSFTATTADQIGFGEAWLKASEHNVDYSALAAAPSALRFTSAKEGANSRASAVVNQGNLAVAADQSILLVGGSVVNTGELSAPGGAVSLVAVNGQDTLRLGVPGSLLSLEIVPSAIALSKTKSAEDGAFQLTDLAALITGSPVQGASTLIVNDDGSVTLGGSVVEAAGVAVSGDISVRSPEAAGGTVVLLGDSVNVVNAVVDASGAQGGTVRIGGGYRGQGKLPTARRTRLDAASVVRADGEVRAGGDVVVWADDEAVIKGTISARGETAGGSVETSAHYLDAEGIRVDAAGKTGAGRWLVDPVDVEVVSGVAGVNQISSSTIASTLNGGTSVEVSTSGVGSEGGDISLLTSINKTTANAA
ncbi:MAG: filamentous hemagglutinin N-terminal domain-containing protein, partial [Phormidesmis sp.]